ncbi:hypothetical protein GCM10010106_15600 [Thermopolyspora flexuosa]|nr:hypothetical protein GCM10010106_15600 [Thermopolyspora flexuosa]
MAGGAQDGAGHGPCAPSAVPAAGAPHVGTGYGGRPGPAARRAPRPGTVVQGVPPRLPTTRTECGAWPARGCFEYDGDIGYGRSEYWALGPNPSFP